MPYGKAHLEFELPPTMRGTLALSRPAKPLARFRSAVAKSLAHPINSPTLRELAGPGCRVCIVFTDITRSCPDHVLVPAILGELEKVGVKDEDVTLLCGTGLHRPSSPEEKRIKLGRALVDRYQVIDHDPTHEEALVDLGKTETGIPLSVHRIAFEADVLIATGIVEPHQYAGYSGGGKTVAIGAGGEAVIAHTHGPAMVDHPGTRLGRIEGNPFQAAVVEASRKAGLKFIVNVVQDEEKQPVAVYAGEPEATFAKLVQVARTLYEVPIPHTYDVAVAGVGFPKDLNLYQASRAVSYLFFAPTCVVKQGGVFILPAPAPEGVGRGLGEQRFLEKMGSATHAASLVSELRRTGYPPGGQRAFIMAKVLEKSHVIVVGSETPEIVRTLKMVPAKDMKEAFQIAAETWGRQDLDVLIVPHAMLTLPVVST